MSNKYNRFSKRSGWIDTNEDRPDWQRERGERYGNNRKWKSKEKWHNRQLERRRLRQLEVDFL